MMTIHSDIAGPARFPWRKALFLYGISYGLCLFFLNALFWDDWAVKTVSAQMERDMWKELGFPPPISFIVIDILQRSPIYIHLATFLLFFAGGWLLFQILQKVDFISSEERQLITILFLVLPINSARVAMQMFNYSYSLFFFYAAWYALVTKRGWIAKLISIVLFLLSFNTLSLVTFCVVPVIHYLLLNTSNLTKVKFQTLFGPVLLLLMAPSYWVLIKVIYPPSEEYRAYYSPQVSGTIRGLLLMLVATSLLGWAHWRARNTSDSRFTKITLGCFLIALGAFPYITSGRLVDVSEWMLNFVPRSSDWDSRNQLLLGLGFAFMITGLIGKVDSHFKRKSVTILVGSCVFLNFTFMQSYMLDARKQSEVIQIFSESQTLKSGSIIMINDFALRYNARGRTYRTFEWNGMLEKAFGNTNRKHVDFGYVDCGNPEIPIPDVLVTVNASNGRFKSLLTNHIGIDITATKISPCDLGQ